MERIRWNDYLIVLQFWMSVNQFRFRKVKRSHLHWKLIEVALRSEEKITIGMDNDDICGVVCEWCATYKQELGKYGAV